MEEKSSYLENEKFESIMRKNYEIYTLGAAIILDRDPSIVHDSWTTNNEQSGDSQIIS